MISKEIPPVVVFGFNRAEPIRKVLEQLARSEGSTERDIIVYLDGERSERDIEKTTAVYNAVASIKDTLLPNIIIRKRECNFGCQKSISSAITDVVNDYGSIIVVEDDVLVSKTFLRYADQALALYKDDSRIWGVNGHQCPYMRIPRSYPHDIYLSPRNLCTGWATWSDRWNEVDFAIKDWPEFIKSQSNLQRVLDAGWDIKGMLDKHYVGKLNSWALPCTFYMIKHGMFVVEPRYSLTKNIGFGLEAVHTPDIEMVWGHQKYFNFIPKLDPSIQPDSQMLRKFKYVYNDPRLLFRIIRKLYRIQQTFTPIHNEPIEV